MGAQVETDQYGLPCMPVCLNFKIHMSSILIGRPLDNQLQDDKDYKGYKIIKNTRVQRLQYYEIIKITMISQKFQIHGD